MGSDIDLTSSPSVLANYERKSRLFVFPRGNGVRTAPERRHQARLAKPSTGGFCCMDPLAKFVHRPKLLELPICSFLNSFQFAFDNVGNDPITGISTPSSRRIIEGVRVIYAEKLGDWNQPLPCAASITWQLREHAQDSDQRTR